MSEHNARGTRVQVRDLWRVFLLLFVTSGLYRAYWMWATARDISEFSRGPDRQPLVPGGPRSPGMPIIITHPLRGMWAVILGWPGMGLLWLGLLPWGAAALSEIGEEPLSATARIWCTLIGTALVIPAVVAIMRLGGAITQARDLAGLPRARYSSGPARAMLVVCDVVGVPLWTFVGQSWLNRLWVRYPRLHDEDLFGALAPTHLQEAAVARRPVLHARRSAAAPPRLEDPAIRPWVVAGFALFCALAFAWQSWQFGWFITEQEAESSGGLRTGIDHFWLRVLTANLVHGSVAHIVGNLMAWAIVGTMLERAVGHARMGVLVGAGILASSAGQLAADGSIVSLGASGVVFAAFGLAVAIDVRAQTAIGKLGWLLCIVGVPASFSPDIGYGAHLGGLAAGVILGVVINTSWPVHRDLAEIRRYELSLVEPLDASAPLAPQLGSSTTLPAPAAA